MRTPITKPEYYMIRELFATVSMLSVHYDLLSRRCGMYEGGQEDFAQLCSSAEAVLNGVLETVPRDRLRTMRKELDHTQVVIRVTRDYTAGVNDEFCYVPAKAIDTITDMLINWECSMCDKCLADAKKCRVYKAVRDLTTWELPPKPNDKCPLQGIMTMGEDD